MSIGVPEEHCLRHWLAKYDATDFEIMFLSSDDQDSLFSDLDPITPIDRDELVSQSARNTTVKNGFCNRCMNLLNHWPKLAGPTLQAYAVVRPCSISDIEAAAHMTCKLCTFLITRLEACTKLETFRSIESRLRHLQREAQTSITILKWGPTSFILWLNLPGKISTTAKSWLSYMTGFTAHEAPYFRLAQQDDLSSRESLRNLPLWIVLTAV
jgi:hypothetical protein